MLLLFWDLRATFAREIAFSQSCDVAKTCIKRYMNEYISFIIDVIGVRAFSNIIYLLLITDTYILPCKTSIFIYHKPVQKLSSPRCRVVGCRFPESLPQPLLLHIFRWLSFISLFSIKQHLTNTMSIKTDLPSDEKDMEMGPLVAPSQTAAETPRHRSPTRHRSSPTSNKGTPVSSGRNSPESPNATGGGKVLSSCAMYSFCSVSMVLVNKSLASGSVPHRIVVYVHLLCALYLHVACTLWLVRSLLLMLC
jgi:hypothetical protein